MNLKKVIIYGGGLYLALALWKKANAAQAVRQGEPQRITAFQAGRL